MNFFPQVRGLLQLGEKKSSKPPTPPITSSLNTRTNSNAKIIKINELESQTRRSFPLDMRTKWNGVCRMANTPHYTPTNPPHVYITDPRPHHALPSPGHTRPAVCWSRGRQRHANTVNMCSQCHSSFLSFSEYWGGLGMLTDLHRPFQAVGDKKLLLEHWCKDYLHHFWFVLSNSLFLCNGGVKGRESKDDSQATRHRYRYPATRA